MEPYYSPCRKQIDNISVTLISIKLYTKNCKPPYYRVNEAQFLLHPACVYMVKETHIEGNTVESMAI